MGVVSAEGGNYSNSTGIDWSLDSFYYHFLHVFPFNKILLKEGLVMLIFVFVRGVVHNYDYGIATISVIDTFS